MSDFKTRLSEEKAQLEEKLRKIIPCYGQYYNFKKGFEKCICRNSCNHYTHYLSLEKANKKTYDLVFVRFKNIKEFRTCNIHDNPELPTPTK